MEVTDEQSGNVSRVTVTGEIDASTSPALGSALSVIVAGGADHLVLDLSGVTFLSSSGLSALLQVRSLARSVRVEPGNELVDRLLALTDLTAAFSGAESEL
jgi:anti-sigma B factor antagonist